ncbi:MAG TPA: LamG-like jellyroll fold domain-containing protein [Geminicoccaceae bacterium]|nr:LamG-like jellyroll fold domain-containing protein [Geminicoccaceae bacterium]
MATRRSYSATFEQAGLTSAAVARYRFDEDAGSTDALDPIGGLDGSYEAGAAPGAAGSIGDGAASFADGLVLVDSAPSLELASGSIELWFTPGSIGGQQMLFSKNVGGGPSAGDIEIMLAGDTVAAGMQSASATFNVAGGSVAAGADLHVVFNFGAGGMQLVLNGQLVDDDPDFTGGLVGNVEDLGIGARVNGGLPFEGVIDEVAIYDRALTTGEIDQLFEGGEFGSRVIGTAAADRLIGGSDAEELRGARGDDRIVGNDGNDELRGGGGDDVVRGGAGDDDLFGGQGRDKLRGGGGDDLLNGGGGKDLLTGGAGSDTFAIDRIGHGVDKIFDFEDGDGGDVLDLSALLDFGGDDEVDDFVRLNEVNGNTRVEVDASGGGDNFTAVFNLVAVEGLDVANLVDDGNLQLSSTSS